MSRTSSFSTIYEDDRASSWDLERHRLEVCCAETMAALRGVMAEISAVRWLGANPEDDEPPFEGVSFSDELMGLEQLTRRLAAMASIPQVVADQSHRANLEELSNSTVECISEARSAVFHSRPVMMAHERHIVGRI